MSIVKIFVGLLLCGDARQKRKLDEMYDQLRSEYDSVKRSAIQPANHLYSRTEPDLFSNPNNLMDNHNTLRKGNIIPKLVTFFVLWSFFSVRHLRVSLHFLITLPKEKQLTYLLQVGCVSLLKLQGQGRIFGLQGKTVPILEEVLTFQLIHHQGEHQFPWILETEGLAAILPLEQEILTLPWLSETWFCLQ